MHNTSIIHAVSYLPIINVSNVNLAERFFFLNWENVSYLNHHEICLFIPYICTMYLYCLQELQLIFLIVMHYHLFSHQFTILTAIFVMDPGPDVGVYSSFMSFI